MLIGIDASRTVLPQLTGTEFYARNLIQALSRIDFRNQYRLYFNQPTNAPLVDNTQFESRNLPWPRFWTQARLALECFCNPPDILFVPSHTLPVFRRKKIKTVVTVHDLGAQYLAQYHQFPQRLYLNRSTEYIARHATHLIAVSESTKKDLQTLFQVPESRISVIYEGVDLETFKVIQNQELLQSVRKKYQLPSDYILFVGTIQPRKNLVNLIKAFALSRKQLKKQYELILVGKNGWLNDDIYQEPMRQGIKDHVRFLNYIDKEDLPVLYNCASLFILPSFYEGFGLPCLEAMACGCPVCASDVSSLPEVVGQAGLLFDPYQPESISNSIAQMLNDDKLREISINMGLQRAKQFSWKKCAEETLKVFERIYHEG